MGPRVIAGRYTKIRELGRRVALKELRTRRVSAQRAVAGASPSGSAESNVSRASATDS